MAAADQNRKNRSEKESRTEPQPSAKDNALKLDTSAKKRRSFLRFDESNSYILGYN